MKLYDVLIKIVRGDFVIEYGKSPSNPNFEYEKYRSGKIVYHFIYNDKFSFPAKSGNLYYTTGTITPPTDIPQPIEITNVYGYFDKGSGICGIECNEITNKTASFFYWCGSYVAESSPLQKRAHIYMEGRWK